MKDYFSWVSFRRQRDFVKHTNCWTCCGLRAGVFPVIKKKRKICFFFFLWSVFWYFRYFSVFGIPTSASVLVFKNIAISVIFFQLSHNTTVQQSYNLLTAISPSGVRPILVFFFFLNIFQDCIQPFGHEMLFWMRLRGIKAHSVSLPAR